MRNRGFNFLKKIMGESLRQSHAENLSESIRENLVHLLNARQGMLPHMPDYGLPDVHKMFQSLPKSLEALGADIRDVIVKYEPRLKNVQVRLRQRAEDTFRATFIITAEVREGSRISKLTFRTEVLRDGAAETYVVPA